MKKDHLTRLARWARWMLPPQEAEDVIADYRDILEDEELSRELGKLRDVIRPLADRHAYRTWLAVFVVLAACILIPAASPLPLGLYPVWFALFSPDGFLIPGVPMFLWFMIAGLALSLVWFRPRRGEAKTPLPRSIFIVLAVLLAVMGLVWWTFWQITLYLEGALANPIFHLPMGFWWPLGRVYVGGNLLTFSLEWSAIPLAAVGMVGLVKARTRDRRWRAVYFLSLSAMMLAFAVLTLLTSMDVTSEPDTWYIATRQICLTITALGLIGTGVSLC